MTTHTKWELFINADYLTKCACAYAAGDDVFRNAMLSYETKCEYRRQLFDGNRQKRLVFFNNDRVDLCRSWFLVNHKNVRELIINHSSSHDRDQMHVITGNVAPSGVRKVR